MLDIQPTEEDDRVQAVDESLRNAQRERQEIESRLEDLEIQIPAAERELDDVKADEALGDATEGDVEDAKAKVEDLKSERDNLKDRLDTLQRVESRLQTKRREAVQNAAMDRQEKLNSAAEDAMSALLDALNEAEQAVDALQEIRDFSRQTKNHVDAPPETLGGVKGIGFYGHGGSVKQTHDSLKKRFGSQ